jgi:hypothetical protein
MGRMDGGADGWSCCRLRRVEVATTAGSAGWVTTFSRWGEVGMRKRRRRSRPNLIRKKNFTPPSVNHHHHRHQRKKFFRRPTPPRGRRRPGWKKKKFAQCQCQPTPITRHQKKKKKFQVDPVDALVDAGSKKKTPPFHNHQPPHNGQKFFFRGQPLPNAAVDVGSKKNFTTTPPLSTNFHH